MAVVPADEHRARRMRAVEEAGARGCQSFLATSVADVFYLSGFDGSNGWLLLHGADATLFTDGRYREQAAQQAPDVELVIATTGLARALAERPSPGAMAVEPMALSWGAAVELEGALDDVLRPLHDFSRRLRAVKTEGERAAVERALTITEDVLRDVAAWVRPGVSEREVAARFDHRCRLAGADEMAFDTIVAAGEHGALPHARPGDRVLREGDAVVLDGGARLAGYCSDTTRSIVVGEPAEWFSEAYGHVANAFEAAVAAIAPGVACRDVDAAARTVLDDAGLGDAFAHAVGHGVGIEIHEAPRLASTSDDVLEVGMLLTVEPGVYLPGRGGIRLEDMVWVGQGGAERLNRLSLRPLHAGRN